MKRKKNLFRFLLLFLVIILAVAVYRLINNAGIQHLITIAFSDSFRKESFEKKHIWDDFPVWQKGFSKTYRIKVDHLDVYEIGFEFPQKKFPRRQEFMGVIQFEVYSNNKLLYSKLLNKIVRKTYNNGKLIEFRKIILTTIPLPVGNGLKEMEIRLKVIEPDPTFKNYPDAKLYLEISGSI